MSLVSDRADDERDTRLTLAWLWVWALINYIYGDILNIFTIFTRADMQAQLETGTLGGIPLSDTATLVMAAVMELSVAMPFLCWKLPYRANRIANIIIGALFTLIMGAILFGSGRLPPLSGYTLYGVIEMMITAGIIRTAWRWKAAEPEREMTATSELP